MVERDPERYELVGVPVKTDVPESCSPRVETSESRVRSGYLELARSFREMANVASISQADAKIESFAARMVGRFSGPH